MSHRRGWTVDAGETLATAREAAGLTQADAAPLLGISLRTLSRWETGEPVKETDVEAALAAYLSHANRNSQPQNGQATASSNQVGNERHTVRRSLHDALRGHKAQVWLAEFRLELAKGRTAPTLIENAIALVTSPAALGFFVGGREAVDVIDWTDKVLLEAMEQVAQIARDRIADWKAGRP